MGDAWENKVRGRNGMVTGDAGTVHYPRIVRTVPWPCESLSKRSTTRSPAFVTGAGARAHGHATFSASATFSFSRACFTTSIISVT